MGGRLLYTQLNAASSSHSLFVVCSRGYGERIGRRQHHRRHVKMSCVTLHYTIENNIMARRGGTAPNLVDRGRGLPPLTIVVHDVMFYLDGGHLRWQDQSQPKITAQTSRVARPYQMGFLPNRSISNNYAFLTQI